MSIYTELQESLAVEKEIRVKLSRNKTYFKLNPKGSEVRILPLLGYAKHEISKEIKAEEINRFFRIVREHWVRREDSTKSEVSEKHVCWASVISGKFDVSSCPFCTAIYKIKDLIETQSYSPEERKYLESLIYNPSDKVFAKIGMPLTVWYMNIIDFQKPLNENPLVWGCSQSTIQVGVSNALNLWPNMVTLENGNNLHITRKDNSYIVMPAPPTILGLKDTEIQGVLGKRKDFSDVYDHKITREEAKKIVEEWVDFGKDWFSERH